MNYFFKWNRPVADPSIPGAHGGSGCLGARAIPIAATDRRAFAKQTIAAFCDGCAKKYLPTPLAG
jgi:hypothetical protein